MKSRKRNHESEITEKEHKDMLDERWVFHENAEAVQAGQGVVRRVLAYSKDLMCVENTFEKVRWAASTIIPTPRLHTL